MDEEQLSITMNKEAMKKARFNQQLHMYYVCTCRQTCRVVDIELYNEQLMYSLVIYRTYRVLQQEAVTIIKL